MKRLVILLITICMSSAVYAAKPDWTGFEERLAALEAQVITYEVQIDVLLDSLEGVTRGEDSFGYDTLLFSGLNVQIVNGLGGTHLVDGTGNLIIGYNELRDESIAVPPCPSDDEFCNYREGSHSLVVGKQNNYSEYSYGGMVIGYKNTARGHYSSVSSGGSKAADLDYCVLGDSLTFCD